MAQPNIYQTIMNAESGGKNVPNYMYDSTHTASGYFQITNSTWASTPAGQASGVTRAIDAPYATQQAAAGQLIQRNGLNDWAPYDHIDSNVSHYDTTPLSGPNGSPTATPAYNQPTTGGSDASTSTYTKNSDGTYQQTSANGTTKAIAATTPIAIATGSDELAAGAAANTKATNDTSTANTKTAVTTASSIWQSLFTGGDDLLSRIGFVVVGLVLLAGGLWIVASEEGAVPGPAAVANRVRKVGATVLA